MSQPPDSARALRAAPGSLATEKSPPVPGKANNGVRWFDLAQHALSFVLAMYSSAGGYFYTGTLGDQITINTYPSLKIARPGPTSPCSTIATRAPSIGPSPTSRPPTMPLAPTPASPAASPSLAWSSTPPASHPSCPAAIPTPSGSKEHPTPSPRSSQEPMPAMKTSPHVSTMSRPLSTSSPTAEPPSPSSAQAETVNGQIIPVGEGLVASTSVMDTGFYYTYGPSLHIGATG